MAESELATLDCTGLDAAEVLAQIQALESGTQAVLTGIGCNSTGFSAGISLEGSLLVQSSLGDFACSMSDIENLEIDGDVGDSFCHSFRGGRALVRGQAGEYVAAYSQGGFVVVHGVAGFRCGYRLDGAEIFVRGTVGNEAGALMKDGALVLGNGAGADTGKGMKGGTIYVRGDVESFADHVKPIRMKDADSMRLSLLLARAGIKGGVIKEFKAYRPR